ncbi:MAG: hypothetical protein QE263_08285 [Vampirovibrionales bacterium]|nr:hypothetical protein [Vampirovibrionales bacterium]
MSFSTQSSAAPKFGFYGELRIPAHLVEEAPKIKKAIKKAMGMSDRAYRSVQKKAPVQKVIFQDNTPRNFCKEIDSITVAQAPPKKLYGYAIAEFLDKYNNPLLSKLRKIMDDFNIPYENLFFDSTHDAAKIIREAKSIKGIHSDTIVKYYKSERLRSYDRDGNLKTSVGFYNPITILNKGKVIERGVTDPLFFRTAYPNPLK